MQRFERRLTAAADWQRAVESNRRSATFPADGRKPPDSTGMQEYGNIARMKTTIDVPDALYKRLKVRAAQSGVTIRYLVLQGIQRELGEIAGQTTSAPEDHADPERHSYVDEEGWPVLKRGSEDRTVITNEFVNRLREEEGV